MGGDEVLSREENVKSSITEIPNKAPMYFVFGYNLYEFLNITECQTKARCFHVLDIKRVQLFIIIVAVFIL